MTANVLPQQVAEFLGAGMIGHVAKPVRQRELLDAVAAALSVRPPFGSAPPPQPSEPEEVAFDEGAFRDVAGILPPERLQAHVDHLEGQVAALSEGNGMDGDTVGAAAHKIVSQAGMLGLPRLSARAREVEETARDGKFLAPALARFRIAAADIRAHLVPRLAREGESRAAEG
jgi:HPt (histidine-containing phosphotransfer) domain-containing protein